MTFSVKSIFENIKFHKIKQKQMNIKVVNKY